MLDEYFPGVNPLISAIARKANGPELLRSRSARVEADQFWKKGASSGPVVFVGLAKSLQQIFLLTGNDHEADANDA